ncbi:MAG: thiamine pyrophosphate-binding protein [bacterium]|nr:thiamine pyrophosphate-binding protein [bacterium]
MRVADYIVKFLEDRGVSTVFMIAGGQAMWLNDALQRSKISPICTHHEQAAAMAAEAYGRISGKLGVCMVTAGPAGVNALNGVVGAFVDSSPMLVISGQSALPNVEYMKQSGIRQYGLQGIYLEPMIKPVTKYFVTVDDAAAIAYYLEKAVFEATTGRPGPAWIEVPLDVQRMEVPEKLLHHFEPPKTSAPGAQLAEHAAATAALLNKSQRPLLLVGQGVRIAKAEAAVAKLLARAPMPVVTTRLGIDVIDSGDPLFAGRPGLYGDRSANFAVQTADVIVAVGARLDPGMVGYDAKDWGRHAQKVIVDLDEKELHKPGLEHATRYRHDARAFLEALEQALAETRQPDRREWISRCQGWRRDYPTVSSAYQKETPVNSYFLADRLSQAADARDVIVVDTSSPFHVVCQAWRLKLGQRFLTTGGISTMGYWAAGIGACLGDGKRRTIIVTGDGCLQMNLQELATVKHHQLPIKLFVINNNGYLLIRHTQKTHMEGRMIGESPASGLWCPDSIKIAEAYGIRAVRISSPEGIDDKIQRVLSSDGPVICDVLSPEWQPVVPRVASEKRPDGSMVSRPYEDLFPFLSPDELRQALAVDDSAQ